MSSLKFSIDADGDHLRKLLDQRAARVDIQPHCPSVSDFSDSPSVYSRSFFSPYPQDSNPQSGSPTRRNQLPPSLRSPLTDRERLNDPSASSLDLGDDPRSSFCSTDSYDIEGESILPYDDEDDASSMSRMSVLGPKMRFHSLAPWEMETESLQEEDELESGHGYMTSAFGGMFSPGITSVAGGFKKGFGFGSSNPKAGTSRPSADSVRTQTRSKGSFESTSSQESSSYGARVGRGKEASRSTASLVSPAPYVPSNLKQKFTAPYEAPSALGPRLAPSNKSHDRSSSNILTNIDTNSSRPSTPSSTCHEDDVHPYANPDLVLSYVNEPPRSPMQIPQPTSTVSRSDSSTTVTNTATLTGFSSYTPEPSIGSEPGTPVTSIFQSEVSSLHSSLPGSPIQRLSGNSIDSSSPYSGWVGNTEAPNFTLISLEEARAMRARSTSTNQSISSGGPYSFTEQDGRPSANPTNCDSHVRTRSISAGAKGSSAFPAFVGGGSVPRFDRRGSEPAVAIQNNARTVKQKKSGFLRIFNGREKDKPAPPPVPQIAGQYVQKQQYANGSTTSLPQPPTITLAAAPRSRKARRIPVPPLNPDDPASGSSSPTRSESTSGEGSSPTTTSHERLRPGLSINTSSREYSPPRSATGLSISTPSKALAILGANCPQSAPPGVTAFPALQLRPVSTMFSSQFEEHIRSSLESTAEVDSDTNSVISPAIALTPLTPGFGHRIEERPKAMFVSSSEDVNSTIVQVLQEEITQAKLAWQTRIQELEGQVRDLKSELDVMRGAERDTPYCDSCGRGKPIINVNGTSLEDEELEYEAKKVGVVNRPRARTGSAARFGNGN